MPCLNQVFEELGIHHEEHNIPLKVLKSIKEKAKKAATNNATMVVKSKKRKGASGSKTINKKQKIIPASATASAIASAAASAKFDEEVVENATRGSASSIRVEGEHSAASLDLGGDDFIEDAL